jgi:hypothetical protein
MREEKNIAILPPAIESSQLEGERYALTGSELEPIERASPSTAV